MSPPDGAPLEALSPAELRNLVGELTAEVGRLRAENQVLRDEVARLKGLPPRPPFKGYQDILVRELRLSAEVVRYRRERWLTPAGETVLAPLPAGIVGGFGPGLRRFLLVARAQGQVTTERLAALLNGIGVEISKRQVVRLLTSRLDDLLAEDGDVLRAGLATARWVTVDDTAARHARRDGVTTQIGDDRFTAFRTGPSKSREAFLSTLRAGHGEYVVDEAALAYMRSRALAGPVIERLAAHPAKAFAGEDAWKAHLAALGIDRLPGAPDPGRIATGGALWGAIHRQGFLAGAVIVSDDPGPFRGGGPGPADFPPPHRLRGPRPAAGAPAPAQGRTAARARATRNPAAHQRLRERHPGLRHQAQGLRRHHEQGRAHRPRRPARPDEDLPQARRLVLPLPRGPVARPGRRAHPAAARPRPAGRHSLTAQESAPLTSDGAYVNRI